MWSLTELWVEKYRPKRVVEVVGNRESVEAFVKWMKQWELGRPPEKRAVLLYGPAGVGKTSLVLAYGKEHGYDVVEVNASDWRDEARVKAVVGESSLQATLEGSTRKIILVDEVDGIAGREDAGGIAALSKIINETRVPLVLVANNPWDPKLAPIREKCLMLEFRRLKKAEVVKRLKEIAEMEGIKVSDVVLEKLAERSEGDLRSAINDFQAITGGREMVDERALEALGSRNRVREIFDALRMIFNAKSVRAARAALEGLEVDLDLVYTWILDNAPEQIPDPEDLAEAFEALARADLILARVNRKQEWKLMRYAIPVMTGGVALARKHKPSGFVKFTFPPRIRFLQATSTERELRRSIAQKIATKLHLSTTKALSQMLPYISFIMVNDGGMGEALARYFEFTPSEINYLKGGKAEEVKVVKARGRTGRRKS
ncbi:MAG: replication factor C large subunit [Aigarchaeota archaeon]|nr:replication factor C large subunit [Candidatus Wolframiiraptor gerlachensis]